MVTGRRYLVGDYPLVENATYSLQKLDDRFSKLEEKEEKNEKRRVLSSNVF